MKDEEEDGLEPSTSKNTRDCMGSLFRAAGGQLKSKSRVSKLSRGLASVFGHERKTAGL